MSMTLLSPLSQWWSLASQRPSARGHLLMDMTVCTACNSGSSTRSSFCFRRRLSSANACQHACDRGSQRELTVTHAQVAASATSYVSRRSFSQAALAGLAVQLSAQVRQALMTACFVPFKHPKPQIAMLHCLVSVIKLHDACIAIPSFVLLQKRSSLINPQVTVQPVFCYPGVVLYVTSVFRHAHPAFRVL